MHIVSGHSLHYELCTNAQLHICTSAQLYNCTTGQSHNCTIAQLHSCTTAFFMWIHSKCEQYNCSMRPRASICQSKCFQKQQRVNPSLPTADMSQTWGQYLCVWETEAFCYEVKICFSPSLSLLLRFLCRVDPLWIRHLPLKVFGKENLCFVSTVQTCSACSLFVPPRVSELSRPDKVRGSIGDQRPSEERRLGF